MGAYVTETAHEVQSDTKINHVLMAAAEVDQQGLCGEVIHSDEFSERVRGFDGLLQHHMLKSTA